MHERKLIVWYYLKLTNETSAIDIHFLNITDIQMINQINGLFTINCPSSNDMLDVDECVCNGAGWRDFSTAAKPHQHRRTSQQTMVMITLMHTQHYGFN